MENFFIDDHFCSDLDSLGYHLDIDNENVNGLPEDWKIEVMATAPEKIFTFKIEDIIDTLVEMNEDRLPEDSDSTIEKIKEALKLGIDEDKINAAMPRLWYPNDQSYFITKADLVEYFK